MSCIKINTYQDKFGKKKLVFQIEDNTYVTVEYEIEGANFKFNYTTQEKTEGKKIKLDKVIEASSLEELAQKIREKINDKTIGEAGNYKFYDFSLDIDLEKKIQMTNDLGNSFQNIKDIESLLGFYKASASTFKKICACIVKDPSESEGEDKYIIHFYNNKNLITSVEVFVKSAQQITYYNDKEIEAENIEQLILRFQEREKYIESIQQDQDDQDDQPPEKN